MRKTMSRNTLKIPELLKSFEKRTRCNCILLLSAILANTVCSLYVQANPPGEGWQILEDVVLVDHRNNDGDSFRVNWGEKVFVVRLYFVDAPESKPTLRERVAEQAAYFGITSEQAVEVGRAASDFVLGMLREKSFTVTTRWQNYPDRVYGFVTVDGRDLGEMLIENGLGRNHGQTVRGMTDMVRAKLAGIEAEAKEARRGAWAITIENSY
jgi:endonuclease YncB( thermonuclease family)